MEISSLAWFNGVLVPTEQANPSVASNTLHLGISVFDGIMAYWNRDHWYVHWLDAHLERFCASSTRMGLNTPWTPAALAEGIAQLLETVPKRTHYLRPIAYRTAPEVFFEVDVESSSMCVFATPVERDADGPYSCQMSARQRVHHRAIPATWKVSGAYANSYLAEREAKASGFDTGLMLDASGRVAEAGTSNIFFLTHEGLLTTPRLNGDVFPGITRALFLDLAREQDIRIAERDVMPGEIPGFAAAFATGTLCEVRAVDRIGVTRLKSSGHPQVQQLIKSFREITHQ
jgi:branched-chain amino acid aminotransferase